MASHRSQLPTIADIRAIVCNGDLPLAHILRSLSFVRVLFPTRALALLLMIGLADLLATAILHGQGLIVETNPLMAPLLAGSEWNFVGAKAATLVLAWLLLARHARTDLATVRRACGVGSALYLAVLGLTLLRS